MVQWSPDTTPAAPSSGGYDYRDHHVTGFSLTHLSGAGCAVYGDFPFLPTTEPLTGSPTPVAGKGLRGIFQPGFSHREESGSPGAYSVALDPRHGGAIGVALTATTRTGFARFTFPASPHASVLVDAGGSAQPDDEAAVAVDPAAREITGSARSGLFCGQRPRYRVYFAARFGRAFASSGTWTEGDLEPGSTAATDSQAPAQNPKVSARAGAYATFDTRAGPHRHGPGRDLLRLGGGRPGCPARGKRRPRFRRAPRRRPRALGPRTRPRPRQRRVGAGPEHLLHGDVPRAAGAADLRRRRRRLSRHGRGGAPGARPHPVRRPLGLGRLPHPDPAAGDDRAAPRRRHRRVAPRRRRTVRLPAPVALRRRAVDDDGRGLGRPDDRRRRGLRRRRLRSGGGARGDAPRRHRALRQPERRIPGAPGPAVLPEARLGAARRRRGGAQRELDLRHAGRGLGVGGDDARVRDRRLRDRPVRGARRGRREGGLRRVHPSRGELAQPLRPGRRGGRAALRGRLLPGPLRPARRQRLRRGGRGPVHLDGPAGPGRALPADGRARRRRRRASTASCGC